MTHTSPPTWEAEAEDQFKVTFEFEFEFEASLGYMRETKNPSFWKSDLSFLPLSFSLVPSPVPLLPGDREGFLPKFAGRCCSWDFLIAS